MLRRFNISDKRIVEASSDRGSLVVVIEPNDEERAFLQSEFQLDDFDLGSTMDADEVPRVEVSDFHSLLIWKLPETPPHPVV